MTRQILPFEGKQEHRLELIPLLARYKFDSCGVRPSLMQWRALPMETRQRIIDPVLDDDAEAGRFRHFLSCEIERSGGAALTSFLPAQPLPWDGPTPPTELAAMLAQLDGGDRLDWTQLPRFYRYVLCKLSTPSKIRRLGAAVEFFMLQDSPLTGAQ